MPIRGLAASAFTEVGTSPQETVGSKHEFYLSQYNSWVTALYIYNADVASLTQGMLVQRKASEVAVANGIICVTAKTPKSKLLGVVEHTIAAGSYGWIICEGRCQVAGDGSVTANSSLMSNGTSGRASNATLTNADEVASVFGLALEDDGAAGSLADAVVLL